MRNRQQLRLTQTQRLVLNTSLQTSIALLRSDAAGLTRYLEEQAAENPFLRLGPAPEPQDWLPRWSGVFQAQGLGAAAELPSSSPSLIAHVLAQIDALSLPCPQTLIALALVEALEPSGWLGRDLGAIATSLGLPLAEVEAVLMRLQRLDPAGIFARNLAECLRLQAEDSGVLSAAMERVLQNLDILASGDIARLARQTKQTEAQARDCLATIRAMNPKPGADFSADSPSLRRPPDLLVRPEAGGWSVALNGSALPSLQVDPNAKGTAAALSAARAVERMVQARNATLLLVGRDIVQRQQAALRFGQIALLPMTMADLAETLGVHESTISRVVAGASLDTPHGTWWLRSLFSPALGAGGLVLSAAALRAWLSQLIGAEPRHAPLSDAALVVAIAQNTGVALARRTVAKYRETLGIPAAYRRKSRLLPPLGEKGRSKG
jgi:RNA polymerase sigma-54 factor